MQKINSRKCNNTITFSGKITLNFFINLILYFFINFILNFTIILAMYFIHKYSVYFLLHLSYIKHFIIFLLFCIFSVYFRCLQRTRKLVFLCVYEIHSVSLSCLLVISFNFLLYKNLWNGFFNFFVI